jgi:8-oxo-dGTP diphosphatase
MEKIQRIEATAFILKNNKLLILKRSENKKVLPGYYEMPGGGIEFGESPEEAIKREIKEETGLETKILNPYCTFSDVINNKQYIDIQFYAKIIGEDDVKLSDEHTEYKWISRDEINNYKFSDQMKEVILKGFDNL